MKAQGQRSMLSPKYYEGEKNLSCDKCNKCQVKSRYLSDRICCWFSQLRFTFGCQNTPNCYNKQSSDAMWIKITKAEFALLLSFNFELIHTYIAIKRSNYKIHFIIHVHLHWSAITLKPGKVNNIDYLITMAPVKGTGRHHLNSHVYVSLIMNRLKQKVY